MKKINCELSTDLECAIENAEVIIRSLNSEEMNGSHLFLGIWNNDFITKKLIRSIGNSGYYEILNGISEDIRGGNIQDLSIAFEIINDVAGYYPYREIDSIDVLLHLLNMENEIITKWADSNIVDFVEDFWVERVGNDVKEDDYHSVDDNINSDKQHGSLLEKWCTNLNEQCMNAPFDPVIARDVEIARIENILCRRKKNNPVLVGDPGVGKTAIIEGLVEKIISGKSQDELSNKIIYSTTAGELTAGTRFRGDLEERIEGIISELEADQNKILFIDEIHTVMKKSSDIADLIKPALSGKKISCIGATTHTEWRKYFSKDGAMSRRMSVVTIDESNIDNTIKIINSSKKNIEEFHGVDISTILVSYCVELADKWIQDNQFPDKALDVVDEACVLARRRGGKRINQSDIELAVSNLTGGKARQGGVKIKNLSTIQNRIKKAVKGQDDIISDVCDFIRVAESGLGYSDKPKGVFLFRGTSGIGKTELCKSIAAELKINMIKIDMGEYSESHSVSKIIGSPPGYVGYDEGGKLTEQVHRNPHSIIVLDEIEKAHPNVLNSLLGVFDDGCMTDSAGRKIDFTHTYIIMTSNVASKEDKKGEFGFTGTGGDIVKAEMIRVFSAEFINRINFIANFNILNDRTLNAIISNELGLLKSLMHTKNVEVKFSHSCRKGLLDLVTKEKMGARPVSRVIHNKIKPLLSKILLGKKEKTVNIIYKNLEFKKNT